MSFVSITTSYDRKQISTAGAFHNLDDILMLYPKTWKQQRLLSGILEIYIEY